MNQRPPWMLRKGLQLAVGLITLLPILAGCHLSPRNQTADLHPTPAYAHDTVRDAETVLTQLTHVADNTRLPARTASPTLTCVPPTLSPSGTATPSPTLVPLSSNAVAFITDGQRLSPHKADSLWAVNLDGSGEQELLNDLKPAPQPLAAWSPDQRWLAVSDLDGLRGLAMDSSVRVQSLTLQPGQIRGLAWAPDSRRIAFTQAKDSGRGHLVIRDLQDGSVIDHNILHAGELAWSRDGQRLAFADSVVTLAVLDLRSDTVTQIDEQPNCGGTVEQLTWLSDGRSLASWRYGNGRYGRGWVCVYDTARQQPLLIDVQGHSTNFAWDPESRALYLIAVNFYPDSSETPARDLDTRLLKFSEADGRLTRLASLNENPVAGTRKSIDISPDEKWLSMLFTQQDRNHEIGIFEIRSLDGTKISRWPVDMEIADNIYAWAGDSRHLLFASGTLHQSVVFGAIYALDIDTGNLTRLTGNHWIKHWAAAR